MEKICAREGNVTVNLLFLTLRALDPVNCHTVIHTAAYAME